jgi:hypothetical protein
MRLSEGFNPVQTLRRQREFTLLNMALSLAPSYSVCQITMREIMLSALFTGRFICG